MQFLKQSVLSAVGLILFPEVNSALTPFTADTFSAIKNCYQDNTAIYCFANCPLFAYGEFNSTDIQLLQKVFGSLAGAVIGQVDHCENSDSHTIFHLDKGGEKKQLHWYCGESFLGPVDSATLVSLQSYAGLLETHEPPHCQLWEEVIMLSKIAQQSFTAFRKASTPKFIYPSHYMSFKWDCGNKQIMDNPDIGQFLLLIR
jgi:hypothetical protein